MNCPGSPPIKECDGSGDRMLVAAMREYQAAIDAGRPLDRAAFLMRHAAIAPELTECLDGLQILHDMLPQSDESIVAGVPLGDFRIVCQIGRGGMGIVYEAEQLSLGRRVALKILPFAATLDARQLHRFRTEATAAAHLHHPHIVQVYGVGCERGVHYYAMQFVEGRTLADVIRDLRKPTANVASPADTPRNQETKARNGRGSDSARESFRTAARWGLQAAEALEHAHQFGVIHRDIKPANLLLDSRGEVYVTDFGLAHVGGNDAVTLTGDMIGTLRYMSPEQARGDRVADPRSDVYSLGATLYELLTLNVLFPGADRQTLLRQVLEDDPTPARQIRPTIPAELAVIVHQAMAKAPEDRYATAQAMADDLRAWLDDLPIRGRPPTLAQRAAKWARRHRAAVWAALASLVLATLCLLVSTIVIAGKHDELRAALGDRDRALSDLSDRRQAEADANIALSRALDNETRTAYSYRLPLVQRAWRDGDLTRARQVLDECSPDLRGWEWHYLQGRLTAPATELRPATRGPGRIEVAYAPGGRTVVCFSTVGSGQPLFVRLWDAGTRKLVSEFDIPAAADSRLELCATTMRCALFPAQDGPVRVFDVLTHELLWQRDAPTAGATAVRFNSTGTSLAVAGADGSIAIWDATTGDARTLRPRGAKPAIDLAWSPDGKSIALLESDGIDEPASLVVRRPQPADLRILDAATGSERLKKTITLEPPFQRAVRWLQFSPDGRHLSITLGVMAGPLIVNASTGNQPALPPNAVVRAFSPDGRSAFFVQPDRTAGIADLQNQRAMTPLRLREPNRDKAGSFELNLNRCAAAFSPDGLRVAFAHDDGRISVWDAAAGQDMIILPGAAKANALAFAADGSRLVAASIDHSVTLWDLAEATHCRVLARAETGASTAAMAASPDGRMVAALRVPAALGDTTAARLVLIDAATGRESRMIDAPVLGVGWAQPGLGELRFSADGRRLAAAGLVRDGGALNAYHRAIGVWDVESGTPVHSWRERAEVTGAFATLNSLPALPLLDLDMLAVRFDEGGRLLASLIRGRVVQHDSDAKHVQIWDAIANTPLWALPSDEPVRWATLSADGRYCAVTRESSQPSQSASALEMWDVRADRLLWSLPGQSGFRGLILAFSPDGRRILTQPVRDSRDPAAAPWRTRAVIWDVESGQALCEFQPPSTKGAFGESQKPRFVFSSDGRRLASFGAGSGLRIWDAGNGRELLALDESGPVIAEAAFTRDAVLVTRDQGGTICLWDGRRR